MLTNSGCLQALQSMEPEKTPDSDGIPAENEIKVSHYADDTTLILDGSKESLICALQVLENFSLVSGLKLNNRKTEALWIGAYKDRGDKLCPGKT